MSAYLLLQRHFLFSNTDAGTLLPFPQVCIVLPSRSLGECRCWQSAALQPCGTLRGSTPSSYKQGKSDRMAAGGMSAIREADAEVKGQFETDAVSPRECPAPRALCLQQDLLRSPAPCAVAQRRQDLWPGPGDSGAPPPSDRMSRAGERSGGLGGGLRRRGRHARDSQ